MASRCFRNYTPWLRTIPSTHRQHFQSRFYHCGPRPKPLQLPVGHPSLLPLLQSCSNLVLQQDPSHAHSEVHILGSRTADGRVVDEEFVVPFFISPPASPDEWPVGYLRTDVVRAFERDHESHDGGASPWSITYADFGPRRPSSVSFASWVDDGSNGERSRTTEMQRLIHGWKDENLFADMLRGWSYETYPIYHHAPQSFLPTTCPIAFAIERAALPLFGFAKYGSLLIAYFWSEETSQTMFWIPRRSMNKRTWPGRLDVTVGGGISVAETAMSTIVRECAEEASLDMQFVWENVRPVGALPFPNRSPAGWILPGFYYLFDLPLPPDGSVRPRVNAQDGEVDNFELMDARTVLRHLVDGLFKSSSALALVDFFIRHGFITEDSDPRFADLCRMLKPDMIFPMPWQSTKLCS